MSLEEKKIPEDIEVKANVEAAMHARLLKGELPCAEAFAIVHNLSMPPYDVGRAADVLGIHLTRCQLGIFGYEEKQGWTEARIEERDFPTGFEEAVRVELDSEGHLSCARVWQIAQRMGIPRMQVGWFVDQMGIQITPCQLGAF
jgi:hypothetical protein